MCARVFVIVTRIVSHYIIAIWNLTLNEDMRSKINDNDYFVETLIYAGKAITTLFRIKLRART